MSENKLPWICPDHPHAQIRHEWLKTVWQGRGMFPGNPLDHHHQYFCNECGRELAASQKEADDE